MCFGHGLKICMWFGYYPQIIFSLFPQVELSHFQAFLQSTRIDSEYLVCATPPSVNSDSFETSQAFWSWSEDVHVVWI